MTRNASLKSPLLLGVVVVTGHWLAALAYAADGVPAATGRSGLRPRQSLAQSELRLVGGLIGVGVDSLIWPRPSFPGDTFRLEIEVVHRQPLKSRPDQGIVKLRNRTLNQRDEVAQEVVVNVLARRRPTS